MEVFGLPIYPCHTETNTSLPSRKHLLMKLYRLQTFHWKKTLKQMSSRFACCACQCFAKILPAKVVRLIWRSKHQRGDVSPVLARRNMFSGSWQWRRQATRWWHAMIMARRPQSQTSTALNTISLCQSIKFKQSRDAVGPETCDMDSFVDCACFTSYPLPLFMTCFHLVDHSDTFHGDNLGQLFSSWPCPAVRP